MLSLQQHPKVLINMSNLHNPAISPQAQPDGYHYAKRLHLLRGSSQIQYLKVVQL